MTKREIILKAGQRLFAKYGPSKTTVEDIIQYAQVAKGTFYKHFSDKGVLFLEVAEMELQDFLTSIETAVSSASTAREKMRAYLVTAVRKSRELENFSDLTKHTFPHVLTQLHAMRDRLLDSERKIIHDILEGGVHTGELAIQDIDRAAYTLVIGLGIHRLDSVWIFDWLPMTPEQTIDELIAMLFDGIQTR